MSVCQLRAAGNDDRSDDGSDQVDGACVCCHQWSVIIGKASMLVTVI